MLPQASGSGRRLDQGLRRSLKIESLNHLSIVSTSSGWSQAMRSIIQPKEATPLPLCRPYPSATKDTRRIDTRPLSIVGLRGQRIQRCRCETGEYAPMVASPAGHCCRHVGMRPRTTRTMVQFVGRLATMALRSMERRNGDWSHGAIGLGRSWKRPMPATVDDPEKLVRWASRTSPEMRSRG